VTLDWLPAIALGGCASFVSLAFAVRRWFPVAPLQREVEPQIKLRLRNSSSPESPDSDLDNRFSRLVDVTHTGFETNIAALLVIGVGVLVGAALFVQFEEPIVSILGAMLGMILSYLGLIVRAAYVRSKIQEQLPHAVDMLAGAIRAGVSVEGGLSRVASKTQGFLGYDLRLCDHRIELGLPTSNAIRELADRYQLLDLKQLAVAVAIHQQTGGDLAKVMEQLARVSRERQAYRRQISSLTISARLAAAIVGSAAPGLLLYYSMRGKGLTEFWDDPSGRFLLLLAAGLEIGGVLWILAITRKQI